MTKVKNVLAGGVATMAAVLVGAAVYAYPYVTEDPVVACERRAEKEHARIAEKLEVYSDVKVSEPVFLEDCAIGELGAAGQVVIRRSVGAVEALKMLGKDWEINEVRRTAMSADGWHAYVRRVKVSGEPGLELDLYP